MFEEKEEKLSNFMTPAIMAVIGVLLPLIGALSVFLLGMFIPIISPDPIVANITLNLIGQIFGIIVMFIFLIPLLKVQNVEYQSLTIRRVVSAILVYCFAFVVIMGLGIIMITIFSFLGMPVIHSYQAILPTAVHISNPLILTLFLVYGTIGAAIFEELIYRRTLIPLLESRGMAPFAAVITSSIGFAALHVPNDILNGSPGYVITHFISTFTIGLILGLTYVATRNVIVPMLLHGLNNLIAFTSFILVEIGDLGLILIYGLILLLILSIGFIVGILGLVQYFKKDPPHWVTLLKEKSPIKILPGVIGFIIICVGLVFFQILIDTILALLLSPAPLLFYGILFAFYLLFFATLLWFITRTHYIGSHKEQTAVEERSSIDGSEDQPTLSP